MKVLLVSIGTRGDMEPFLAIGAILKKQGHDVSAAFPEQFRNLADSSGMNFYSLGSEFIEMIDSETGKIALGSGGTGFRKFMAFAKLAGLQKEINKGLVREQNRIIQQLSPDLIVHNPKAMVPVMWEVDHPGQTVFVSPVPYLHYVKGHAHLFFRRNLGTTLNKWTYALADWGLLQAIWSAVKLLGIQKLTKADIKAAMTNHKVAYTVSPQLFQRSDDWPDNIRVVGYHERDKTTDWKPSEELRDFIKAHQKIMFITFGSMTNPKPDEKTRIVLEVLKKHEIPAIINTAAGGLKEPDDYDRQRIHFVSDIPYDWIFPQVYAVVHHGGSGTTHSTLKYGCASMIVPHIIDQFVWNELLNDKGVGPKGPRIGDLGSGDLESKLLDLYRNAAYRKKAEEVAAAMKQESLVDEYSGWITEGIRSKAID